MQLSDLDFQLMALHEITHATGSHYLRNNAGLSVSNQGGGNGFVCLQVPDRLANTARFVRGRVVDLINSNSEVLAS